MNEKIEAILTSRLEQLLEAWVTEFTEFEQKGGELIKNPLVLDVKLLNRTIMIEPSLPEAKAFWYKQLHEQIEVICGLERITTQIEEGQDNTYKNLLLKMGEKFNINTAYKSIEKTFKDARDYIKTWKSYQALWDID